MIIILDLFDKFLIFNPNKSINNLDFIDTIIDRYNKKNLCF
jgi:hypothetical protein